MGSSPLHRAGGGGGSGWGIPLRFKAQFLKVLGGLRASELRVHMISGLSLK